MMRVPFADLQAQYQSIKPDIDQAIQAVIAETAFIGGKFVQQFEKEFADAYGVNHCIPCANGTDAIYIVLRMLGIGPGDEVITTACSWISTAETISQTGASPVFIDIEPDLFTIDASLIEAAITPHTKAIIPVHLYGQIADMTAITAICEKYQLYLIEDCAQAHFSTLGGQKAGTFGQASTFSFFPGKNLGAYGDAGAILAQDAELARRCRMYANHGALVKHQHEMPGINSRLDGLQAAILSAKLPHLAGWLEKRIACADRYDTLLADIPQVQIPRRRLDSTHTFHLYVIRAEQRDALAIFLKERGIETLIHYPTPLPFLKAYASLAHSPGDFPVAADYQSKILSIPIFPELSEEAQVYVAECIRSFYA